MSECPSEAVKQFLLVFSTVLHSIAVIITCSRLWVRVRLRRLWWEDAWVALALCFDIISAVSTWILTLPERDQPWYMSRQPHIVATWLTLLSYTCLVWAARMSIVFSLMRMVLPSERMRTVRCITCGCAVLFSLLWALCVASKAYACGSNKLWYNHPQPNSYCPIGLPIAMIEFTTNIVSDVILVALPTWILWRMKLPRNERILIHSIFSMSLFSVMVSVVYVVFLFPAPGLMADMTANIEGALDLMICNLLFLVTSAYRFCRNREDIESMDDGFSEKSSESQTLGTAMDTLTTVDLEHIETMSARSTQSAPTPRSGTTPIRGLSRRSSLDAAV